MKLFALGDPHLSFDKEGNEITDAQVDVELKNHEFKFGWNAFLADEEIYLYTCDVPSLVGYVGSTD